MVLVAVQLAETLQCSRSLFRDHHVGREISFHCTVERQCCQKRKTNVVHVVVDLAETLQCNQSQFGDSRVGRETSVHCGNTSNPNATFESNTTSNPNATSKAKLRQGQS